MIKLYNGDCLNIMRDKIEDNFIDTIITDPPYGLSFMGKKWDYDIPSIDIFKEMLRVLKPGGTLLCFAGSRTQHRMAVNIEDSGFILKDCIMFLYGSGFPKATDIYKKTKLKQWNGWKSHGLKPAYEPIILAVKPNDGSYANNALKHGVSGLNIVGGMIKGNWKTVPPNKGGRKSGIMGEKVDHPGGECHPKGRYPANIILDESINTEWSRYFYTAKASSGERNEGCDSLENGSIYPQNNSIERGEINSTAHKKAKNSHPTVKPESLMIYLCELTKTPTGGIVLDPFMGSGTTGIGCKATNRKFIGIEKEPEYFKIAEARLKKPVMRKLF